MARSDKKPFYKRGWVWRLAVYLFLLFATFNQQAEPGSAESPRFQGLISIVVIVETVAYFLRRRQVKRQSIIEKSRRAREVLNARVDALSEEGIQPIQPSKAILRNGEQAFFAEAGTLHEMKSVSVRHTGISSRVRVAKGVSIGFGGGRSTPETQLVELSDGELVATDRRVIFAGRSKSFEAALSKVINVECYSDAVLINLAGREKPYVVKMPETEITIFEETFRQIISRQA